MRGEYEESVSSLVAVTQRRPARKKTGSEAPTQERTEEREDIVTDAS